MVLILWHWCVTFLPLFHAIAICKGILDGLGGHVIMLILWHCCVTFLPLCPAIGKRKGILGGFGGQVMVDIYGVKIPVQNVLLKQEVMQSS